MPSNKVTVSVQLKVKPKPVYTYPFPDPGSGFTTVSPKKDWSFRSIVFLVGVLSFITDIIELLLGITGNKYGQFPTLIAIDVGLCLAYLIIKKPWNSGWTKTSISIVGVSLILLFYVFGQINQINQQKTQSNQIGQNQTATQQPTKGPVVTLAPTIKPTQKPTPELTPEPTPEPSQITELGNGSIPNGGSTNLPSYTVIEGDIYVNGQQLFDNGNPDTGLIVVLTQPATVSVDPNWGASFQEYPDLAAAEFMAQQLYKPQMLDHGCANNGCSSVTIVNWP